MAYKFNPFTGKLDNTGPEVTALNTLGVKADLATIQAIVGPSVGDVWQADDTDIFYLWDGSSWVSLGTLGTPGPTGATGATGADGADGSTILSGSGAPVDNVTGSDGDFYIDTAAHTIYGPRTAGAWGVGTSLVAGGATTLGGLTDVDLTTSPPTNGEALVYDSVNSEWVPGSAGATAAGSANQIQYNDGAGGLAASADLTWDNTAKELGVTGDLNLDDGVGGNTTTIQAVTPTQDRTISFPDATGTVALVSGSNGTIQYNDAGTLKGNSDFTVDPDWNDASTVFTGLKLNVTDTASAAGSNLLDLQVGGTSQLRFSSDQLLFGNFGRVGKTGGGTLGLMTNAGTPWLQYSSAAGRGFVGSLGFGNSAQTYLVQEGPGLAVVGGLSNSSTPQTFRVYNTLTGSDVSATGNYERGFLQWNSNVFEIGTEAGSGGGSEQPVRITAATLKLPNLPTYADNAAATTGGLVAGDVYKTATGELRITV